MKKSRLFAGVLATLALTLSTVMSAVPAMADAMRVVTLGADLSDDQKQRMMNYFKVSADEVRIIYVTNTDERNHLGSYVPLEQIGTRTVSCSFVRPTTSGGIKVRTANLNWVTGNMIATALSTSGVSNCEVIAACPFEVSGTGALTGVLMAYEVASGEALDQTKKEIATEEIVVTGNLADSVGQNEAVNVINTAKMEVIGNNIQNADEIYNIVVNIVNENNIDISAEELDSIVSLLEEIAEQEYDYDEMADTLEMVESNVAGQAEDEEEDAFELEESFVADVADEESIFSDIDENVLGDDVVVSSTDDASTTAAVADDSWEVFDQKAAEPVSTADEFEAEEAWDEGTDVDVETLSGDSWDDSSSAESLFFSDESVPEDTAEFEVDDASFTPVEDASLQEPVTEDDWTDEPVDESIESIEDWEEDSIEDWDDAEDISDEDSAEDDLLDTSALDADKKELFEKAQLFCEGEYEGVAASLREALDDPSASTDVELETETGKALSKKVLKLYLSILGNGSLDSWSDDDVYFSAELNKLNKELKKIFGKDSAGEADAILADVDEDDLTTLYDETLAFFEKLYGEDDLGAILNDDLSSESIEDLEEEEWEDAVWEDEEWD